MFWKKRQDVKCRKVIGIISPGDMCRVKIVQNELKWALIAYFQSKTAPFYMDYMNNNSNIALK